MVGNISKRGSKGEKGDVPSLALRYDETTGDLYYSSEGILVDKEYVSSQDLGIGNLSKLHTDNKSSVVAAINELNTKIIDLQQAQSDILLTDNSTNTVYKVYVSNGKLNMEVAE